MSAARLITESDLARLVSSLLDEGTAVFGPARVGTRCEYRRLEAPDALALDAGMPAFPLKALFLPPTETLFVWRKRHNDVSIAPGAAAVRPAVVIGARPCDAAAAAALDKVMGWDYRDDTWFARREATTIVSLACDGPGPTCFCEAVGLGPRSPKGSDVLLVRGATGFAAEALTDKGRALLARAGGEERLPEAPQVDRPEAQEADMERVRAWLETHFDDPLWARLGLRCHGCGACAAVCPACHCFDIVDEPDGLLSGTRRRNWDTCQSAAFTLHASGHNPRGDQGARFRQRVLHKFAIYPRRFGERLCTGCGRCIDACPAGQDIAAVLHEIAAS
jgi:ferredoxin